VSTVRFAPSARSDIHDAFAWLETRAPMAGGAFLSRIAEVERGFRTEQAPHPRVDDNLRCAWLRPFRYGLYYRAEADDIVVLGVLPIDRALRATQAATKAR
jgi:plasmid stabilization system protein ParE